MVLYIWDWIRYNLNSDNGHTILFQELDVFLQINGFVHFIRGECWSLGCYNVACLAKTPLCWDTGPWSTQQIFCNFSQMRVDHLKGLPPLKLCLVCYNRWQQLESIEFTFDELHLRLWLLDFNDINITKPRLGCTRFGLLDWRRPRIRISRVNCSWCNRSVKHWYGGKFAGTVSGSSAGSCLTTTRLALPISLARGMRDDITWIRSSEVRKGRILNLGSVAAAWIMTSFVLMYLPLRSSKIDSLTFWRTSGWFSSLICIASLRLRTSSGQTMLRVGWWLLHMITVTFLSGSSTVSSNWARMTSVMFKVSTLCFWSSGHWSVVAMAHCCSTYLATISYILFHHVLTLLISLWLGMPSNFCFYYLGGGLPLYFCGRITPLSLYSPEAFELEVCPKISGQPD